MSSERVASGAARRWYLDSAHGLETRVDLEGHIEDVRLGLRTGMYVNEASVSHGIVLRFLQAMGWPTYDVQIVCPEYTLERARVDFALCHPRQKPLVLVEVKVVGRADGAERQLFEYAFHCGVPLVVLTDGQGWNFFLPAEQGDYGERRFYRLDIVERDLAECANRLKRYLSYEAIVNGSAIETARQDYRTVARSRQAKDALPKAWAQAIEEHDEKLLEMLSDRVELICGYRPSLDDVSHFIHTKLASKVLGGEGSPRSAGQRSVPTPRSAATSSAVQSRIAPSGVEVKAEPPPVQSTVEGGKGLTVDGVFRPARSGKEILIMAFEEMTKRDPTFAERFASLPKHGRTRRYLANSPALLYPDRPDLAEEYAHQLNNGWWLGTNNSFGTIAQILTLATRVCKPGCGREFAWNVF